MDFYNTKMGHEFYLGTMPKLCRAIETLNKRLEENTKAMRGGFDAQGNARYLVKVFHRRIVAGEWKCSLLDAQTYSSYEHIVAAIADNTSQIWENINSSDIPDDVDRPRIVSTSEDKNGHGIDIEFRYDNGIVISVMEPIVEDRVSC